MPRTVVLTGYSGFLGRHAFEALNNAGWQICLAGRTKPLKAGFAQHVPLDLDRPEMLAALRQFGPFDCIVHLASRVDLSNEGQADMFASNVLATGMLAQIAKEMGAFMLFASSVMVHGSRAELITARSPIDADTPYGRSKWLGEALIDAAAVSHCILRMGGLFGLNGPNHLGINKAIQATLLGQSPAVVGQGLARRNYLYVRDAAQAIADALDKRCTGVHLLAGPDVLTIRNMVETICNILNPSIAPLTLEGSEARHQIIERSRSLGHGYSFLEALHDISIESLN